MVRKDANLFTRPFIQEARVSKFFSEAIFNIIDRFVQLTLSFHIIEEVCLDGVVGEFAQPNTQQPYGLSPLRYSLSNNSFTTGMISSSAQV